MSIAEEGPFVFLNEESSLLLDQSDATNLDDKYVEDEKEVTLSYINSGSEKVKLPLLFIFFRFHNLVCVISLALVIVAQALPPPHPRPVIITAIIHFYALLAGSIGIIVELDVSDWFINNMVPLLKQWFMRGSFYLILGAFAIEESTFSQPQNNHNQYTNYYSLGARVSSLFLWMSSIGLFFTGSLYFVMGALFMQGLKERSEDEFEKRMRDALQIPSSSLSEDDD